MFVINSNKTASGSVNEQSMLAYTFLSFATALYSETQLGVDGGSTSAITDQENVWNIAGSTQGNVQMFSIENTGLKGISSNSTDIKLIGSSWKLDIEENVLGDDDGLISTIRSVSNQSLPAGLSIGDTCQVEMGFGETWYGPTTAITGDFTSKVKCTVQIMRADGTLVSIGSKEFDFSQTTFTLGTGAAREYWDVLEGVKRAATTYMSFPNNPRKLVFDINGAAATSQEGDRIVLDIRREMSVANTTGAARIRMESQIHSNYANETISNANDGIQRKATFLHVSVS